MTAASSFDARLEKAIERKEHPRRPRAKTISNGAFDAKVREVRAMIESGDWSQARPAHFVALYAMGHERVYGVAPAELDAPARMCAAGFAARMLERDFAGDARAMYEFVRWTWNRERSREEWRRENGREGGRVSYRLQFGGHLLTDYRLAQQRRRR